MMTASPTIGTAIVASAGGKPPQISLMTAGSTHSQFPRPRAVCFDIGETLVDETRHWSVIAAEPGIPVLTHFGVHGGTAARLEHRTRVFDIWGSQVAAAPLSSRSTSTRMRFPVSRSFVGEASGWALPVIEARTLTELGCPSSSGASSVSSQTWAGERTCDA
jgi:hypothetical protein